MSNELLPRRRRYDAAPSHSAVDSDPELPIVNEAIRGAQAAIEACSRVFFGKRRPIMLAAALKQSLANLPEKHDGSTTVALS